MENIFYNDRYYSEIEEILIDNEWETEEDLPDHITVWKAELQPMFKLTPDWILDRVDEERSSEDGDEGDRVRDLLEKHINFDLINESLPKLWYEVGNKIVIKKEELIKYL